jgi:hypothetical protein
VDCGPAKQCHFNLLLSNHRIFPLQVAFSGTSQGTKRRFAAERKKCAAETFHSHPARSCVGSQVVFETEIHIKQDNVPSELVIEKSDSNEDKC